MTPSRQRRFVPALLTSASLLAALSCGGGARAKPELEVMSSSPETYSVGDEPIQMTFREPVVADEQIGQPLQSAPVSIEPALEVTAHWQDRQTLVLTPRAPLARSTRYRVALTGELGERTGGHAFSFVHEPLVVDGILGSDLTQLPVEPTLALHFNQPVDTSDVIEHCHIRRVHRGEPIDLVAVADAPGTADRVSLKPARKLAVSTAYQLTCEDLAGAGGNVPLDKPYVLDLATHATFAVTRHGPAGWDVPADDVEIEIEFATPVDLEAVREHLTAEPAVVGLDHGWLDRSGTTYKTTVNLETQTNYKLAVTPGLTDTFGQTLEKRYEMTFATGNARPRLSVETGIYALEPQAEGYPVWTRNVRDFDVECAPVPKGKIVSLLTSALDYDPWYNAGSDQSLDWKGLGLNKRDKRVEITQPKNKWHLTSLALPSLCGGSSGGLYLADIRSRDVQPEDDYEWRYRPHRRVLANLTDFGVLLKAGTGSSLLWVSSISTGKPVPGATVTIYTPQGRRAHRGTTDKDGILRFPGTTRLLRQPGADDSDQFDESEYNEWSSYRSQRLIAVVEKGGDVAVVDGNWANGIQTWNFGVTEDRRGGTTRIRGFIQSDRGIYRPGEIVHFKGLVREITVGKAPAVPRNARVSILVEDSRGQTVYDSRKRLSEFGGFSFDLKLEEEANLGDYYVNATIKGQTFRERFSVEEFRKVSFEVGVDGHERHGRLGDKLSFQVGADYLFGAPVVGADVEWNVSRRAHTIRFPELPGYAFGDYAGRSWWYYDDYYEEAYPEFVSDGSGKTNRRGRYRFGLRDPKREFDGPQDYIVGVTVRDETDQAVSKRVVVTAHKSDFYLGLHTQEYVQAVGMPFAVNVVAVQPSGDRVATPATLRFIRETYDCSYSDGYRSYRTCTTKHAVELEREIAIPATGTGTERIMPENPGEYIVRITARDARGNEVVASGNIWVIGKGEAFWSGDESARMTLIASKQKYDPGETARLVPRANLNNATALVTVERNGILDAFVKPLASSADGIEIPITDAHAPNVFASVALITGRQGEGDRHRPRFKMGIVELEVSSDDKRLDVEVTANRETYQPGEDITGTVRVTRAGQPVRAEVSVSVADEGVLQLIAYKTPDPMAQFYASWGLGVDASTNWNRIARLDDPAAGDPDQGGDGPGGDDDSVRSNFVSSAFWAPSLVTDASGEVRFTFKAPDNLTAFRMMAVAADTGSQFGSGERRITVKKPLLAKPVLPRFLSTGDRAAVGVVVHNYTGAAGTATVTGTAKGTWISPKPRQVELARDGSARVDFPIKAGKARTATFEFAVEMADHRDAVRVEIPINRPLRIEKKTVAVGVAGVDGEETLEIPVTWDDTVVTGRSTLAITVDRTGMAELEPSLRYLIEYPYGCLEQTLSRFIPLTKVEDLAKSLNLRDLRGPKTRSFIRAGVAKVARHQHTDGHFKLWPSGQPYPHLTVYALYGLTEAKRAGIDVPADTITRGTSALQSWVSSQTPSPGDDSGTMAMAAYVLAELGQPDAGLNARLFESRAALPRYGTAFLLRAMKRARAGKRDIDTLTAELVSAAETSGRITLVRETQDLSHYMSSDIRTSAITLSALLEVDPANPLIEKLAEGLKAEQRPGGGWHNTQENLYSLVALSDYARVQTRGSELVSVYVNGKRRTRQRLDSAKIINLRRPLRSLEPGAVKIETTGRVRYTVRLIEAREDPGELRVYKGFDIARQYLDPETRTAVTEFKTGELYLVQVTIKTPTQRRYVAVVDPLPAGFEAVNTKLATASDTGGASTNSSGWTHHELRDDRALGFLDYMRGGDTYSTETRMEYLVRATTRGEFIAPPAHVEEMYTPTVYGRSRATKVVIKR